MYIHYTVEYHLTSYLLKVNSSDKKIYILHTFINLRKYHIILINQKFTFADSKFLKLFEMMYNSLELLVSTLLPILYFYDIYCIKNNF